MLISIRTTKSLQQFWIPSFLNLKMIPVLRIFPILQRMDAGFMRTKSLSSQQGSLQIGISTIMAERRTRSPLRHLTKALQQIVIPLPYPCILWKMNFHLISGMRESFNILKMNTIRSWSRFLRPRTSPRPRK